MKYSSDDLKKPLVSYQDYMDRIEFLINDFLFDTPHVYAGYITQNQKAEVEEKLNSGDYPYFDKVSMSYVSSKEKVEEHYDLWVANIKMFNEKRQDYDFMKGAFAYELENHEYAYNNYQGNYDTLSAIYGELTYNDDDNVKDYFKEAKMSDIEVKAYVDAVNEYMENFTKSQTSTKTR